MTDDEIARLRRIESAAITLVAAMIADDAATQAFYLNAPDAYELSAETSDALCKAGEALKAAVRS